MDHTVLFDELLQIPDLRARSYVVHELPLHGLACVDAQGRRGEDWFFARRWLSIRVGRRLLYWVLDEAESRGFRFRVASSRRVPGPGQPVEEPWTRASNAWERLTEEERRLHRELFPHEEELLRRGYDWDERSVYRNGVALEADPSGRILETEGGVVHEWVRIEEEWTWRRYPLYVRAILSRPSPAPVEAPG